MSRPTGRPLPDTSGSMFGSRGTQGSSGTTARKPRMLGEPSKSVPYAEARAMTLPPDGTLCNYSSFQCHGERVAGYEYCIMHILCDKGAPFKPCGYSADSQSSSKCSKAAPFYARGESFCTEHTKTILSSRHGLAKKRKPTANVLLDSLAHYKKQKTSATSESVKQSVDPFSLTEETENEGLGLIALESEGVQEETSDLLVGETWVGEGESEDESVDSEGEDCLQHAGVYTAEEVMRSMKDKLVKLQKLYIDQFQRIVHKMRESRRVYLTQLRAEKEAGMVSIFNQPKDTVEYERLKAMLHYYAPAGREALLAARHRERRLASAPGSKPQTYPPCQHTLTTTTKCSAPCIPMAKFCLKHIMEEQGQVLYRACGVVTPADGPCETPVASIFQQSTCIFHAKVPQSTISPLKDTKQETRTSLVEDSADGCKVENVEVKEECADDVKPKIEAEETAPEIKDTVKQEDAKKEESPADAEIETALGKDDQSEEDAPAKPETESKNEAPDSSLQKENDNA